MSGQMKNTSRPASGISQADSITVAGRIYNLEEGMPHTIVLIECDPSDKSVRDLCEFDSNLSFCHKIPFSYPHTFTVNYNRGNFINVFAAPGDSIYMDIDGSTSPLAVTFSGDHSDINNQYDAGFQDLSRSQYSVKLPSDTVALEEYMPVFMNYVREGRDHIDSYAKKHNLSDEVISMLYTDNLYGLANLACGYRGRDREEMRAFFLDPIFDIFNEDNTKVMIFPYHISAIVSRFPDVRENAPKGTVRDIMYAVDEDVPVPERSEFNNQGYYDRLYSQDIAVKEISIDDIKPGKVSVYADGEIKEITDENPLQWLLREYKGKPIYLDVSATWCGPCRVALKESDGLRQYYKGSDIRFVVIWLSSSKEDWLKVAPTLSNTIQIFVDDVELENRITGHLGVNGFPTYFMIDREGRISKEGVPHYRSPDLPVYLDQYK